MPHHRSSGYLPARKHLVHRWQLFRTAELNAVGWAAVAGLCTAGAATGLAAARRTGAPAWIMAPAGGAVALAAVVAADRRKWAGMPTTYRFAGTEPRS